jgi:2'-hydroxyisoflavone reductase
MRVLILGGTAWLGGLAASAARDAGHDVTCLARGESGPVPDGVNFVTADRDSDDAYLPVTSSDWDVVVDVARQPGQVRSAVAALEPRADVYVFVSTGSVYADHATPGQDESAPVLPPLDGDVMASMETYGEAKVACEQHVLAAFGPERSLIARAGLLGGPGDRSDRSGYWPLRFARPAAEDGSVLVPRQPDAPTQLLDARDLAQWLIAAGASGRRGVFNATGETIRFADFLATARDVAGHTGPLVEADEVWLITHGVEPWMGERSLPMWLGDADHAGFSTRKSAKARAAGLTSRPLAETLADVLAWELRRDPAEPRRAGLSTADELALLHELSALDRVWSAEEAGSP